MNSKTTWWIILSILFFNISLYGKNLPPSADKAKGRTDLEQRAGKHISLDLTFRNEEGKVVSLKSLIHKPTILALVYFTCPGICTPLLNELQKRLEQLTLKPGQDFQILSISFDPKDGPKIARKKKKNYMKLFEKKFPSTAWTFLTGTKENIEELTKEVGFHYRKEGKNYRHPGGLIILSSKGKITRYIFGIEYLPADLEMALIKAKKGIVEDAIPKAVIANKTRLFCFVVDPNGKLVGLKITNLAMGLVGITVLSFAVFLFFVRKKKDPSTKEEKQS